MVRKILVTAALAGTLSVLCGCGGTELEDKIFPIEIGLDGTENIAGDWLSVSSGDGRVVDYNHLKVIVLGRDFLTEEGTLDELLDLLEERNDVPRNAWVAAADDAGELIESLDVTEIGLGDTFERIVNLSGQISDEAYPTIGDLYKEQENKEKTYWIPYMEYAHGELSVDHYYAYSEGKAVCDVDADSVLAALFAEGMARHFTVTLDDGSYVELSDARVKKYEDETGAVAVQIKCEGQVYGGKTTDDNISGSENAGDGGTTAEKYEEMLAEYMNSTFSRLSRDTGLDTPDSVSVKVNWK
jgi:hypothetical protein